MGKAKAIMGAVDALGNKIGALGDYLKEFDPRNFYHYSDRSDIEKFNPYPGYESFGEYGGDEFKGRGATYFTSDPKYANEVFEEIHELSKGEKISESGWEELIDNETAPTIYPVKIKTNDIFDFENPKHKKMLEKKGFTVGGEYEEMEQEHIQKALKNLGFRGYRTDEPGTVGLFFPDKGDVRSVFAKFDPSKSKKGEILAAVPAGTLGALGAMDGESSN